MNQVRDMPTVIGISTQKESDYEFSRQLQSREEFVNWAENQPKYNIDEASVQSIVEKVRAKRYGGSL